MLMIFYDHDSGDARVVIYCNFVPKLFILNVANVNRCVFNHFAQPTSDLHSFGLIGIIGPSSLEGIVFGGEALEVHKSVGHSRNCKL